MFGLITGSGLYDVPGLVDRQVDEIATPYGPPVLLTTGRLGGIEVCFIPRHGSDHSVPPNAINYRANIAALHQAGATAVLATAVVGSIEPAWGEGTMAVLSDVINFTSGRPDTFFDGTAPAPIPVASPVVHTDMSDPYHPALRQAILTAAAELGIHVEPEAVYCCTNGPRFETKAEIAMMGRLGGQVVGMTGYPEVALAVEVGLPYASIALVSNHAAGVSPATVSVSDIIEALDRRAPAVFSLVTRTLEVYERERSR
ncbi:MAG: S-methyl-5'-thioinosine phosphorylase [Acidimicrobiia bacterium]|nr:S-methyl-5'-thioinosine phosphorylase [Acidimicrobiia bacterium]MDH5519909.1 S-methyl-5'-thioinosine phosphorylase [Acidimicrobiia bacterium]